MKSTPSLQRGTSLVEVLVTLALGLVVSAGAIAMVISNREAYRSTEAVSRIQESTRVAFEIMSRDLRLVGVNACNGGSRVLNVLGNASSRWWSDWSGGLRGFDEGTASLAASFSTGTVPRVAGTDLVEVMHGGTAAMPIAYHNASDAEVTISAVAVPAYSLVTERPSILAAGDLAIVCDFENTAIFQVSGVDTATNSVKHEVVTSVEPGNCTSGLAFRTPLDCTDALGVRKVFPPGSQVMRLEAAAWYVGNNGRTGPTNSPTSLYRVSVGNNGAGGAAPVAEEIVEGVSNMQVRYMVAGVYRTATEVTALSNWNQVSGVEIALTIEAPDANTSTAGVGARLTRSLSHVVNLRNRVP
jgi:type IV pilus assembly protein PilW